MRQGRLVLLTDLFQDLAEHQGQITGLKVGHTILKAPQIHCPLRGAHVREGLLHLGRRHTVVLNRIVHSEAEEWELQDVFNLSGAGISATIRGEKLRVVFGLTSRDHLSLNLRQGLAWHKLNRLLRLLRKLQSGGLELLAESSTGYDHEIVGALGERGRELGGTEHPVGCKQPGSNHGCGSLKHFKYNCC